MIGNNAVTIIAEGGLIVKASITGLNGGIRLQWFGKYHIAHWQVSGPGYAVVGRAASEAFEKIICGIALIIPTDEDLTGGFNRKGGAPSCAGRCVTVYF